VISLGRQLKGEAVLRTKLRNIAFLHVMYRSVVMFYKRRRYRLKQVHSTFLINGKSCVSRDLIAHEYSSIGPDCSIGPRVEIGRYVMFAPRVAIVGGDHKYDIPGTPMVFSGRSILKKTIIEPDVWVGYGAIILAGITVGRGSIIAAGAVVTKDVPPYEIHAGIPARKIGNRFVRKKDRSIHDKMLSGKPSKGTYAAPLI